MARSTTSIPPSLGLKVGDLVEVRRAAEILSTLDERGTLEGLPFMPEMLQYSGKRFRVYKRAHKACDTIEWSGLRKMENAVHLEILRCDGKGHGDCEAGCLLFWKEAWLKRVSSKAPTSLPPTEEELRRAGELLHGHAQRMETREGGKQEVRHICQATEIRRATLPMAPWNPRQFWEDWASGNTRAWIIVRGFLIALFNAVQRMRRGVEYPYIEGFQTKTPTENVGLRPGELVQVKSKLEIMKTLDRRNRNRGLSFDREMVKYCGGTYRVLRHVKNIINDRTGKMMRLPNDCIILDGVICQGDLNKFCPRSILPYWREIWLQRVSPESVNKAAK